MILNIDNLKIYSEDRIGIVGVNGVGKTTLLNILSQRLRPDAGQVKLRGRCSYVSQLYPPENKQISAEMASKFGVACTWNENMSGGEKTRFKLAAGLDADNLMIFADEPTSNIDVEGIELVENRLREYRGGLVLISHDRSFLDKLCNKILEVENGKIRLYTGNYTKYSRQKAKERERAQFEYKQYIGEKKRLEQVVTDRTQKARAIRQTPKRMGNSEARLHKMGGQKAKVSLGRAMKNTQSRIEHLEVKEKPLAQQVIKFDADNSSTIYSKTILAGNNICKAIKGHWGEDRASGGSDSESCSKNGIKQP